MSNQCIRFASNAHKYPIVCVVVTLWSDGVHGRIAAAIKEARGRRSAQWLADRTAELGHPMTRAQIANYESGRKKTLDIADLIVLAAALNTSPVNLVFPGPYDEGVELFPDEEHSQFIAAQWFSALSSEPYDEMTQWREATKELRTWRRLDELEAARVDAILRAGSYGPDEPPPTLFAMQIEMYDKQIREILEQLDQTLENFGFSAMPEARDKGRSDA